MLGVLARRTPLDASGPRPVHGGQSGHARELAQVASNHGQAAGARLSGDQRVVGPDPEPRALQLDSDEGRLSHVVEVERPDLHRTGEQLFQKSFVPHWVGALRGPDPQLKQRNGRERDSASTRHRVGERGATGRVAPPDQVNRRAAVQQIAQRSKSGAGGTGAWSRSHPSRKPAPPSSSIRRNHASTSNLPLGSSRRPFPHRRTRTSPTSGSWNPFGSRTAWLPPCRNTLATPESLMVAPESDIRKYHFRRLRVNRLPAASPQPALDLVQTV